jgi:AraC-like DNA-binding protein
MNRTHPPDPVDQELIDQTLMGASQPISASQVGAALVSAIATQALRWIEDNSAEHIIVARPNFKEMQACASDFPDGVKITARSLQSRRVVVRDRPTGFQFVSARWPGDGVEAKRFPMIACALRGPTDLRISNYVLHCKEGCFVFLPAGIPHPDSSRVHLEGENENRRSCDILWFSPMGEVLRCWICRSENGKHSSHPSLYISQKKLINYLELLFEGVDERDAVSRKIRQGLMIALMSSVQKEIQEGRFFRWLPQSVAMGAEEEGDPIKRAQNYIRQNLGDHLTLERVARYCYMSRSQFARKFHEETGETFTVFLTRCRLDEAKMRLETSSAQIAGISRHVGLKPRHFAQIFQQSTGLTPSEYRRRHNPHFEARADS